MCIIGQDRLLSLINEYRCVYPYNEELMDGDGYVLTVKEETVLQYLEHQNLISNEIVFTPPNIVAHLTAKSKFGRMGLSFLNAAKVHSGFIGRLALEIVNLSNDRQPITIKKGVPFMHIEFITREGKPSPYDGPYQFQYMSDKETEIYKTILLRSFDEFFKDDEVKKMIENRIMAAI